MMNNSNDSRRWPGFWLGVASTIAFIFAIGVMDYIYKWLASNPTVNDIVAWFTKPMFSVYDIVAFLLFLMVVWAIGYMAVYGPRGSY